MFRTRPILAILALSFLFDAALASTQQPPAQTGTATLEVQVQKPIAKVSPTLYA